MIKLIIFDLDGVLVDAKDIHYECLNMALEKIDKKYIITKDEHLSYYDGLKTNEKLELLTINKNLPISHYKSIWVDKQNFTIEKFKNLNKNFELFDTLLKLKKIGYKLACCSNSVEKTVKTALNNIGIYNLFDIIVSNEDVMNSKPHPEIYWKTMLYFNHLPEETLILEDSPIGLLAANRSNCHVLRIKNTKETNFNNISEKINKIKMKKNKWIDNKLNILIPMAGHGNRFKEVGYTFPKPLIDIKNKPMIQVVVENLNIDANFIFVVQKEHRQKYNLDLMLNLIAPNCKIVETESVTEGAACTALLAKEFINNDSPLFFANSDQFVEWDSTEFMYKMNESNVDGGIVTFESTHPKWSFVKLDESGYATEVAEKKPISNIATVGYYYWKHGSDFVKYAERMIEKDIRVNNEFYVCPVFNQAIEDSKKIKTFNVKGMWGLGTPEDLKYYIENH